MYLYIELSNSFMVAQSFTLASLSPIHKHTHGVWSRWHHALQQLKSKHTDQTTAWQLACPVPALFPETKWTGSTTVPRDAKRIRGRWANRKTFHNILKEPDRQPTARCGHKETERREHTGNKFCPCSVYWSRIQTMLTFHKILYLVFITISQRVCFHKREVRSMHLDGGFQRANNFIVQFPEL